MDHGAAAIVFSVLFASIAYAVGMIAKHGAKSMQFTRYYKCRTVHDGNMVSTIEASGQDVAMVERLCNAPMTNVRPMRDDDND